MAEDQDEIIDEALENELEHEYFDDAYQGGSGLEVDAVNEFNDDVTKFSTVDDFAGIPKQDDNADQLTDTDRRRGGNNFNYDDDLGDDYQDHIENYDNDAQDYDNEEKPQKPADDSNGADSDQNPDDDTQESVLQTLHKVNNLDSLPNWPAGSPITLEVLNTVWKEMKKIEAVKPLIQTLNGALKAALLSSTSSGMALTLAQYINGFADSPDLLGTLLEIASSPSKQLLYGSLAVCESFVDQMWGQAAAIFTINKILNGILALPIVQDPLQKIFKVAVPIINAKNMVDKN